MSGGELRIRKASVALVPIALVAALVACGGSTRPSATPPVGPPASSAPTTPASAPPTRAPAPPSGRVPAIGLQGGPGVSAAQLRTAEALLASTIAALPRYAAPAQAYAAGYRSIGDTESVVEHYVNWSYVDDGHILDPKRPESLVYEWRGGKQRVVAAMYMLPFGSTFADVPDVGGALTQWHVHRNLCLTDDPEQKIILRFTAADGSCPPGTSKASNTPMLHVWSVPNRCGPFASLDFGGHFPEGETRTCDTRNASVP
jgi:hypothetical protein